MCDYKITLQKSINWIGRPFGYFFHSYGVNFINQVVVVVVRAGDLFTIFIINKYKI